jgi:hypothetical protein
MAKGTPAAALIVALAKKAAKPKRDKGKDMEAAAGDILKAIESKKAADLARAWKAMQEISSAPDTDD